MICQAASSRIGASSRGLARPAPARALPIGLRPAGSRLSCRAENGNGNDLDSKPSVNNTSTASMDDELLSRSEVQKLAELKREQQRGQSQMNIIQGAIEEAQLITWPTPKKAFLDTILVLGIVIASGSLLFGLNVLLAEASEFWYHRG